MPHGKSQAHSESKERLLLRKQGLSTTFQQFHEEVFHPSTATAHFTRCETKPTCPLYDDATSKIQNELSKHFTYLSPTYIIPAEDRQA